MNPRQIKVNRHTAQVTVVTLDRPASANAFNTEMAEDLVAFWQGLREDRGETRVIVITGAGARAFCAGADLKERHGMTAEAWETQHRIFEAMSYALLTSPLPVIAAVNGAAIGGGCELVLSTDFAYAADSARFAFTEVTLGIIPGIGGTQTLTRAAGLRRAREILMTGQAFSAAEALAWGVVNKVCPSNQLMAETMATAERIATNAPLAVAAARRAAAEGLERTLSKGLEVELSRYYRLIETADRTEGIAAFNEKRPPNFKGK